MVASRVQEPVELAWGIRLDDAEPALPVGIRVDALGLVGQGGVHLDHLSPTGAYTWETDLVDSTSPSSPPLATSSPTEGSWTKTMSPRASWAKSVRPTLARDPQARPLVVQGVSQVLWNCHFSGSFGAEEFSTLRRS